MPRHSSRVMSSVSGHMLLAAIGMGAPVTGGAGFTDGLVASGW